MIGIIQGTPLSRAMGGYLYGPLGMATRGYWYYNTGDDVIVPPKPKPIGGGTNTYPSSFQYNDLLKSMDVKRLQRVEDEEILLIIKLFLKCQ